MSTEFSVTARRAEIRRQRRLEVQQGVILALLVVGSLAAPITRPNLRAGWHVGLEDSSGIEGSVPLLSMFWNAWAQSPGYLAWGDAETFDQGASAQWALQIGTALVLLGLLALALAASRGRPAAEGSDPRVRRAVVVAAGVLGIGGLITILGVLRLGGNFHVAPAWGALFPLLTAGYVLALEYAGT